MKQRKTGRPISDNPKNNMIRVRMDEDMVKKLDECVKQLDSNRSEVIREGVHRVYSSIKKDNE